MKFTIDTEKKVISLVEKTNMFALIEAIKKLLPDGEWRDYDIDTNVTVNWQSPIYIPYRDTIRPWWEYQYVNYDGTTTGNVLNCSTAASGRTGTTFCVEMESL